MKPGTEVLGIASLKCSCSHLSKGRLGHALTEKNTREDGRKSGRLGLKGAIAFADLSPAWSYHQE